MGNFIGSKLFVGITSFVGGMLAAAAAKKTYDVVTQPKPLVFDHAAVNKLKPEDQARLRGLAGEAGLQA